MNATDWLKEVGMTEIYQAANARFEYSKAIKGPFAPTDMERLEWLKQALEVMQAWHEDAVTKRNFIQALQFREQIRIYLDEMGPLIEKVKEGE